MTKRRRPPVPITDPRFVWIRPDDDCEAFRARQRERIARMQVNAAEVAQKVQAIRSKVSA